MHMRRWRKFSNLGSFFTTQCSSQNNDMAQSKSLNKNALEKCNTFMLWRAHNTKIGSIPHLHRYRVRYECNCRQQMRPYNTFGKSNSSPIPPPFQFDIQQAKGGVKALTSGGICAKCTRARAKLAQMCFSVQWSDR